MTLQQFFSENPKTALAFSGGVDSAYLLYAAKRLGADPKDCYVLEDSQNGVRSGYAAGMKCIGIPDVAVFDEDVKNMLTAEFKSLNEAADYFEKLF